MSNSQESPKRDYWQTVPELPAEVFALLHKRKVEVNPVAIVATVDADGMPRTAPFGSLRAVTPGRLRLVSLRYHDTYANLVRDGRVSVAVLAPPDVAVSIRGRARVIKEQMSFDEHQVVLEVDVEEVKNDMVRSVAIESGITISIRDTHLAWFEACLGELDGME